MITENDFHVAPNTGQKRKVEFSIEKREHPPKVIKRLHRAFSRDCLDISHDYELLNDLGHGAFSIVKKAKKRSTGEEFAIKMIEYSMFKQHEKTTEQEISVLSALRHDNIVNLHEVVRTPSHICIVMDLCSGGELFDRIVQKEKYNENDAKKIVAVVLKAVQYLHSQGVVHRDLKPENLIFEGKEENANLKLTDFGFAALLKEGENLNTYCGTPEYVAPEIIRRESYGNKVDLWSIGVVIYVIVSGIPPFYADTSKHLFEQILKGEYDFPSPYFDHVSDDALDLIKNLLVVDPEKRFSVDQALEHRWMKNAISEAVSLTTVRCELQRYNATRKLRKAVFVVIAGNRMKYALKLTQSSSSS